MVSYLTKATVIFIVASALLFTGFFLAWYPHSVIDILELNLGQSGLTQAERDNLESSLSWWSNQGVYTYGSVSNFVLAGGIIVLVYAILYSLISTRRVSIRAKAISAHAQRKRPSLRLIVVLSLVVAIVLSIVIAVLILGNERLFIGSKTNIANLQLSPSSDWKSTIASFTVKNLYNSEITFIGSDVNNANFGYSDILVPPGQTKNATISLNGLVITESPNYSVKLTITFEDGQYEVYSQTYTPCKYEGIISIENAILQMIGNETFLSLTAKNTGNIPLRQFNIAVGDIETLITLNRLIQPKESLALSNQAIDGTYNVEISYPVEYEFIFADESTFIVNHTLQIMPPLPIPTPSPSPTESPTPTPISPTPSPSPTPVPTPTLTLASEQTYVEPTQSYTLNVILSDNTKSGIITLWCWDSKTVVNQTYTGTMTNGVATMVIKPWQIGDGTGSTWYLRAYWPGDYQYEGIYSLTYNLFVGIK